MLPQKIDQWIERTKWPAATLALCTLPFTTILILYLARNSLRTPVYTVCFVAGLGLVGFAARTNLARSAVTRALFRWLHDGIQTVVARLLLHPVVQVQSEDPPPEQSRVRWIGKGNWLFLAAPYSLPVLTFLLWIPSLLLFASLRSAVLGVGLGLHLAYVAHHWYHGTSELKRLGDRFCWMYLPAVNLLLAGLIFAFAVQGFQGVWQFMVDWITLPWDTWNLVWNWFIPAVPLENTK